MTDDDYKREWHLDRRFSLALIIAVLGQAGAAVWFASKTDSRVEALERRHIELAHQTSTNRQWQIDQRIRVWERVNDLDDALNDLRADTAGITARLDYIGRALDRLTYLRDARAPEQRAQD